MPLIALEEHYVSRFIGPYITPLVGEETNKAFLSSDLRQKLADFSLRIEQMDSSGISTQVVSHTPVPTANPIPASACAAANTGLQSTLQAHPDRLAGFACLPMAEPEAAAEELKRCVRELGFVGALVENHLPDGTFYDSPRFDPVFAAAQELDVPLYIHPTFPTKDEMERKYGGNYGREAQLFVATAAWGWHADVGLHVLRLFAGGVFDRFPRLKVVLGHMGELLPFMLERILAMEEGLLPDQAEGRKPARGLKEVWDGNIWITTSGMFSVNPMACILRNTRVERIMFSVDWPMSKNEEGTKFLEELAASGLVTKEELSMIEWKNAARLLRLEAFQKLEKGV
ncbi:MAG: hypothetical protein Q9181_000645 [Wetmoreana brouardii]